MIEPNAPTPGARSLCRQPGCVSWSTTPAGDCAIHDKYQISTGNERCRKCMKKIRPGAYALKSPKGLEHINKCPTTGRETVTATTTATGRATP